MQIALVVAAAENNVIGKNNQLLWRLPNDMKFFKNTTWGMPVIMGRKTFESLGKPLAGRTNIVITRQPDWKAEGAIVVSSLEKAIEAAAGTDAKEANVIGGGEIYAQALPIAQRIYLTRVHTSLEGDTYFPAFDEQQWGLLSNLDFPADDKHAYPYSFQVWSKR
ncbi:dihydrofolate reductase [Paraflavitalea sp. CAU 1676]|uniref:dihydrofolate reductase n=1 Tax=Paraflavitalea sp. CAU 1676 TaxID=3032598 RepID=UPI0023DC8B4E|nr:dihydrofolate reductase [Paraflavitalea sp. CAU 1676]MDF2190162.1 dihydrofolate reductase [Paraflavitalea sp. CAU 1676]